MTAPAGLLERVDKAAAAMNDLVIFGNNYIKSGGTIAGWDAIIEGDFHLNCVQDSLRDPLLTDTCEARGYACCEGRIPAPPSCIVNGTESTTG